MPCMSLDNDDDNKWPHDDDDDEELLYIYKNKMIDLKDGGMEARMLIVLSRMKFVPHTHTS